MNLRQIAEIDDRDDQVALLVLHSLFTSPHEKRAARTYLDRRIGLSRVLAAARTHALNAINLSAYLGAENEAEASARIRMHRDKLNQLDYYSRRNYAGSNPESQSICDEIDATEMAATQEKMAADPSLKSIVREAYDLELIDGLRSITITSKEEADAIWNAAGFVQLHPAMPIRKTGSMNQNATCKFAHVCSYDICQNDCRLLKKN